MAQAGDAGGQLVLELGQEALGLLGLATLDTVAGPGQAVAERGQLLHRAVVEVGGQPHPLLLGGPQDRLHGPLALGLHGHLAGQTAHTGQGEQEQHDRAAGDHADVDRLVADRLDDQHRRGHQGGAGQQGQPGPGQPHALRGRLGQRHHRRVQGGQAEGRVVQHPDGVDRAADLPGAVEHAEAVHGVHRHQGEQAEGQQPGGDGSVAARPPQPDRHRQQQHVAQRVGDRDRALDQAEVGQADIGPDQEDPREYADASGDDGGVDQAGGVAPGGATADQQQQPGGQQRVEDQVEGVGDRGERDLDLEHPLEVEAVGVADGEQQLAGRD
jgi:hypothetical protein